MRRKKVELKKEMFEWVEKLTPNIFSEIKNIHNFSGILSDNKITREEVEEMIKDYKRERLLESMIR